MPIFVLGWLIHPTDPAGSGNKNKAIWKRQLQKSNGLWDGPQNKTIYTFVGQQIILKNPNITRHIRNIL